jgi:hypothetical protein
MCNTRPCLHPQRVPESGKLEAAPRLHQIRQRILWHQLLPYVCLDRVADFVFIYSVLANRSICLHPRRAPGSSKTRGHTSSSMAQTASSLASTSLFYDYLDVSPSFIPSTMHLQLPMRLPRHRHPTTTSPRTAASTKVAALSALGYLDIGTRAITSHEPSPTSSIVQASATQQRPRRSRSDCGGCQPVGFYVFISSPV